MSIYLLSLYTRNLACTNGVLDRFYEPPSKCKRRIITERQPTTANGKRMLRRISQVAMPIRIDGNSNRRAAVGGTHWSEHPIFAGGRAQELQIGAPAIIC